MTNMKKIFFTLAFAVLFIFNIFRINVKGEEQEIPDMPAGSALLGNTAEDYVPEEKVTEYNEVQEFDEEFIESSGKSSGFVSKKGLQGANLIETQYKDLGVSHTLFNVSLDYIVCSENDDYDTTYEYKGKTYYFHYIPGFWPNQVHPYNEAGWDISIVVLLGDRNKNMIYSGARNANQTYYAWNLDDADMVQLYEAVFHFLGETYGKNDDPEWACFIKNWIIGNEVNMPNAYNYTGTTNLDTNIFLYTRQYKLATEILKSHNTQMKTYISLDHSWMHDDEGRGIAGKSFLDAFAAKIQQISPGIDWNIAYHPYPAIMTDSNIWSSTYTTKNLNTPFISGYNLDVLTSYVKNQYGSNVRIILSEQGFTAYGGQEQKQAASLAYTYYMGEFDDMVDAVIFRSLRDDGAEAANGFMFGLLNGDGTKRPAYNVFKYMDTENWKNATVACLNTMGKSSWESIIPNFNASKFVYVPITEIKLSADALKIPVGYTRNLGYTLVPSNTSETAVKWTSSNTSVASVNANGLVTANGTGVAVITASCGKVTATCEVTVVSADEIRVNVEGFVKRMYTNALNREYDEKGCKFWTDSLMDGTRDGVTVARQFFDSPELIAQNLSNEEFVRRLYSTFFDRNEPTTSTGFQFWMNYLENGVSRKFVVRGFAHSAEFTAICSKFGITRGTMVLTANMDQNANVTMYVFRCYDRVLNRQPDANGLNFWTGEINSRKKTPVKVAEQVVFSKEFLAKKVDNETYIKILYRMFFDREADQTGFDFWMGELNSGKRDRYNIFMWFANSPEFKAVLKTFGL